MKTEEERWAQRQERLEESAKEKARARGRLLVAMPASARHAATAHVKRIVGEASPRVASKRGLTSGEKRSRRLMNRFHYPESPAESWKPGRGVWVAKIEAQRARARVARAARRAGRMAA